MKPTLTFSLLTTIIGLAAAGPYTITYWAGQGCSGRKLSCSEYNAYECCAEPPSPSSFPRAKVTSSGPTGIVIFTEVTNTGECGLCEATGAINQCYLNSPFNTILVASITQCQTAEVVGRSTGIKQAVVGPKYAECNRTVPLDTATVDGQDYDLLGPDGTTIMADVLELDDEEFAAKWAAVHKGPTPTLPAV